MFYCGFADEASRTIDGQIAATLALGWRHIEPRYVGQTQFHDLDDAAFDEVAGKLEDAGIRVPCLGSAVANWQCDPFSDEDFERSLAMLERALTRMRRLKCRLLRGMSFLMQSQHPPFDPEVENAVFHKVARLVRRCEEEGVIYGHENCRNYGGQSARHSLRLLEHIQSPALKLIFDTGNPLWTIDRGTPETGGKLQDSWEFYRQVRDEIVHVHIKDGRRFAASPANAAVLPTLPGEGEGAVAKIVGDLLARGYDGGFSIEPHLPLRFTDDDPAARDQATIAAYVAYGRTFMHLVEQVRPAERH